MIAHVTAASLASENKSLAHPASVDSLPTSANQEDHVSMATFAARRLQPMIANTAHILGIELLAAAQGIEFLRPLASSAALEAAHALLRAALRRRCRPTATSRPTSSAPRDWSRDGALARVLRTLPGLPALWIRPEPPIHHTRSCRERNRMKKHLIAARRRRARRGLGARPRKPRSRSPSPAGPASRRSRWPRRRACSRSTAWT